MVQIGPSARLLMSMSPSGRWSFEVQSTDAAGNQSPTNLDSNWTSTLLPGIPYARILTGPWGPTANKTAVFSLKASTLCSPALLLTKRRSLVEANVVLCHQPWQLNAC